MDVRFNIFALITPGEFTPGDFSMPRALLTLLFLGVRGKDCNMMDNTKRQNEISKQSINSLKQGRVAAVYGIGMPKKRKGFEFYAIVGIQILLLFHFKLLYFILQK
jgi:hypothetical protein